MLDMNKFTGTSKANILHTSASARIDRAKAASNTSFEQRQEVMRRQARTIQSYRHAALGSRRGELRAKRIDDVVTNEDTADHAGEKNQLLKQRDSAKQRLNAATGGAPGTISPSKSKDPTKPNAQTKDASKPAHRFSEPTTPVTRYNPYG